MTSGGVMGVYSTTPVTRYLKLDKIGEGTYGSVYRAQDTQTSDIVALKRVHCTADTHKNGISITTLREIHLLTTLRHPHLMALKQVAVGRQPHSIFLVFELCHADLATLLDENQREQRQNDVKQRAVSLLANPHTISTKGMNKWSLSQVKRLMYSILEGVNYLHTRYVFHRDLKLSNVLLTTNGRVVLADFGLARVFSNPLQQYTPRVVTLWYRSPELLLQGMSTENKQQGGDITSSTSKKSNEFRYHSAIDVWSCGCILAELLLGRPLLPGNTESEQVALICRLLGTPTTKIWPAFRHFDLETENSANEIHSASTTNSKKNAENSNIHRLPYFPYSALQHTLSSAPLLVTTSCCNIVSRMLTYDPSKRITAAKALAHPWFNEAPVMCPESENLIPYNAEHSAYHTSTSVPEAMQHHKAGFSKILSQQDTSNTAAAAAHIDASSVPKKRRRVEVNVADMKRSKARI